MASTNKTTNYDLSQYIGTDKPTYLTDYNQDMSKIDAGIHAAKSEADTNATAIGTLSSLTTTAKTDLVAAVNEVDADTATNANNIATNTSNIATNTSAIGTLANLTTTSKTDLVVAANEINSKVGNLANLDTNAKSNTVAAINEVKYNVDLLNLINFDDVSNTVSVTSGGSLRDCKITVATNSDKSLGKIYGYISLNKTADRLIVTFDTGLTLSESIVLSNYGGNYGNSSGYNSLSIAADGTATYEFYDQSRNVVGVCLLPFFTYFKNFGDTPIPPQQ